MASAGEPRGGRAAPRPVHLDRMTMMTITITFTIIIIIIIIFIRIIIIIVIIINICVYECVVLQGRRCALYTNICRSYPLHP